LIVDGQQAGLTECGSSLLLWFVAVPACSSKLSQHSYLLETAGIRRIEGRKNGSYLDAVIAYKNAAEPQAP
jgi:hypothetical protein